jgi:hypothetical protein
MAARKSKKRVSGFLYTRKKVRKTSQTTSILGVVDKEEMLQVRMPRRKLRTILNQFTKEWL